MELVITRLALILVVIMLLFACGDKVPLPTGIRDDDGGNLLDTSYVAVLPHWTSANGLAFKRPHGVTVGYDRTIYVCDTDNDRIVRLTPTGEFIESFAVPHPHSVAQDRAFNLVVANRTGSLWQRRHNSGSSFEVFKTVDSVYRCSDDPHPFGEPPLCGWYFPTFSFVAASLDARSRFYSVVSNRVCSFDLGVRWQPQFVDSGYGIGPVALPTGVAVVNYRGGSRLIIAQYAEWFGVQYYSVPYHYPIVRDSAADVYNVTLDDMKYVAADDRGNVFVLHRSHGVVMIFSPNGRHLHTFGRSGSDELGLNGPAAISILDETIFIADTQNHRVARYQMTNIPQN